MSSVPDRSVRSSTVTVSPPPGIHALTRNAATTVAPRDSEEFPGELTGRFGQQSGMRSGQ